MEDRIVNIRRSITKGEPHIQKRISKLSKELKLLEIQVKKSEGKTQEMSRKLKKSEPHMPYPDHVPNDSDRIGGGLLGG